MFRRNRSSVVRRQNVLGRSIAPCVEALECRRLLSVPNGPFGLNATAASATSVNLAFYDSATDETGFVVQRSTTQNGTYATVTTLPAAAGSFTTINYTDTSDSPATTYFYKVYATNTSGKSSDATATVTTPGSGTPVTLPAAPSALSATVSGTNVVISFTDNSNNESDFVLQRSTASNGTYATVATISGDSATGAKTYTDSTVAAGTTYYYKLYAENSAGASASVGPASATTPAGGGTTNPGGPPNGPFGLSVTAVSATSVNLSFYDSSTNETGFVVSRSTTQNGTYATIATLAPAAGSFTTVNYTDTTTTGSTNYYYKVYAINGPYSSSNATASVTTPAGGGGPVTFPIAPSGLTATVSGTAVLVSFTDNSNNESDFVLQRSTAVNGTYATVVTITGDGATGTKTYTDASVVAGTTYYYKVYAENAAGASSIAGPASVTTPAAPPPTIPNAPTALAYTVSGGQVVLTFTDNSTDEADFVLQRSTSVNGPYTTNATLTGVAGTGTRSLTDGSGVAGTTYYYKVFAENAAGASTAAGPLTVVYPTPVTVNPGGPPNGPFGMSATAASANAVNLAFYDSATNETGFVIQRATSQNGTYLTIANLPAAAGSYTTITYADTTTVGSTTYYYRAYAVNGPYVSSNAVATVTTPAGGTPATIPAAPTNAGAAVSGTSVVVTFTDNSANETDFVVQRSATQNGTYATVGTVTGDGLTGTKQYTDGTVSLGTTYYYKVYAENTAGASAVAGPASVTLPSPLPPAPSGVSAAVSGTSVVVTYTDNSTNESGFVILRSTSAAGTYTTVGSPTGQAGTGVRTFTDSTVAPGTTYYYEVYATNGAGSSTVAGPASVTTPVASPQTPAAPTNAFANASGSNVYVSFNDNATNETDLVVQRSTSSTGVFATVGTMAGDAGTGLRSYLDANVAAGTTYYYRVYAENASGPSAVTAASVNSNPGLPATANPGGPPSGPYGTTANALNANAVQLQFVDSADNETGFVIIRSTTQGSGYTQVGTVAASTGNRIKLSFVDVGVTPGTTYYYEVYAVNGPYGSNFDGPVAVTTPAGATGNAPTDQWVPYATLIGQSNEVADYPAIDGTGVTVAVIDRGIDYNAPGLSPSKIVYGYNFRDNNTVTLDDYGHGTGVAGIIAANGYTFNGQFNRGVAPAAKIVSLKQESSKDIKAALDWVIANAKAYDIQVINLTDFITDVEPGAADPSVYQSELQTIWNMNIFISTPVGNGEVKYGPNAPISYPALSPYVLGAGGVTQAGTFYPDSLRGNGLDVLGPADGVTMPFYIRAADNGFDAEDDNYDGTAAIVNYGQGTSWASAYVSGTAALIKQVNKAITPAEIMTILKQTGTPTLDPTNNVYYPTINVDRAVAMAEQLYGPNGTSTP